MPRSSRRAAAGLLLAMGLLAAHPADADITILTAGAYKPVLRDLAAAFEARSGETLIISNDTAGGVAARVARGEEIDVAILPMGGLDTLAQKGKIVAGTSVKLAKSGIGVVVKKGAPVPDISTVEAFKAVLLAAPSIAYIDPASGGSSGIYLAKLFDGMGIAQGLKGKTVLVPGGLVASRVDNGQAALGLQQISELRAVPGVIFVGPLPDQIQNYTIYGGGIAAAAPRPAAGKALLAYLRGDAARQAMIARGLEQP